LLQLYPCFMTFISYCFPHLFSTNQKCTHPCHFSLLLKLLLRSWRRDNFYDDSFFYRRALPRLIAYGLWSLSLLLIERIDLDCSEDNISCNNYTIFEMLAILYSLYYGYMWKLIPGHVYYDYLVLALKLGVT
jgi:hypothetical protein